MAPPDVSGLGMVALYPLPKEASTIASFGSNPAETMHVTMVFLGEVADLDMKAVAHAVGRASGSTAPLSGRVGGAGVFAEGEGGYPQIVIPNVKGLSALRTLLVDHLAEAGIESPSEHDWVPHMTLAYIEEPALPDLEVIGSPLTFSQLSLVVEDERKDFVFDPEGASDDAPHVQASVRFSRAEQRRRELLLLKARA